MGFLNFFKTLILLAQQNVFIGQNKPFFLNSETTNQDITPVPGWIP
jgi:hypothetical protein